MYKLYKKEEGFSVVEPLLAILVIAVIGFGGYYIWRNDHKDKPTTAITTTSNQNNKSTQTQNPKTEQDLASIGQAIENLTPSNSAVPALVLPTSLSKLHVQLNYNVNSYAYKILEDDGGEKNSVAIYEICANFNSNTFSVTAYNNSSGAINNPGSSPNSYALHSQGEQCFTNSITQEVNGVDLVASNNENQYKEQINNVSSEDWPTDDSNFPPIDLLLADDN
jgi:type II secretory pathway pseudopilin PulG